jgi:hypothetical protein
VLERVLGSAAAEGPQVEVIDVEVRPGVVASSVSTVQLQVGIYVPPNPTERGSGS